MRKNLQPTARSEQPQDPFITELGALLAKQTNHRQPMHQRQAVANLADYVRVARSHHNLTRAALAQQIGKSEAELYALEQGLLPYAQLDLRLLCTIADALGEEVETLLLLVGQPALAHSLRQESTHKHGDKPRFTQRRRTISKQIGNWLGTFLGVNLFSDHARNLVDSWQEGRLWPYLDEKYRSIPSAHVSLRPSLNLGLTTSALLLVCLLLIGVSTYSFPAFFDAQSGEDAYTTLTIQTNSSGERMSMRNDAHGEYASGEETAQSGYGSNLLPITSTAAITPIRTIALAQRRVGSISAVPVDPANDQPMATLSLLLLPTSDESQRCDWRTNGRFTICRI